MSTGKKIAYGLLTIFIAIFMLFYIFDSINKLAEKCEKEVPKSFICERLSGFTLSMLVILLIITGFVSMVLVTSYILLSS